MLGPCKERHVDRLVRISLDVTFPATNISRHVDAALDLSFAREWVDGRPWSA